MTQKGQKGFLLAAEGTWGSTQVLELHCPRCLWISSLWRRPCQQDSSEMNLFHQGLTLRTVSVSHVVIDGLRNNKILDVIYLSSTDVAKKKSL